MGRIADVIIGSTAAGMAAGASRMGRWAETRRVDQANRRARGVGSLGVTDPAQLFVRAGNALVTGGEHDDRIALAAHSVAAALRSGIAVVVLGEGSLELARAATTLAGATRYHEATAANRSYDPLAGLGCDQAGLLVAEALDNDECAPEAGMYLGALAQILAWRGVSAYVRMLASCPHASLPQVIEQAQDKGLATPDQAAAMRARLAIGTRPLGALQRFLASAASEGDVLAGKDDLVGATSITEHARLGGTMGIDVASMGRTSLLALVGADIALAARLGARLHVAVDARSIATAPVLVRALLGNPGITWTLTGPDFLELAGSADTARDLQARASQGVWLAQGQLACDLASELLGEYDKVDLSAQSGSGANVGLFGLGHASNASLTATNRRERIIKPEQIRDLDRASGSFVLADRLQGISFGSLRARTACLGAALGTLRARLNP